ncbi:MAG: hypothetical protein ABFR32_05180 [Bacteroidota bacterium]
MNGRNSNKGHGRGSGNGSGQGFGHGGGQGRNNGKGSGPGGFCECAKCGEKIPHQRGVKCTTLKCPSCGNTMVNELLLEK